MEALLQHTMTPTELQGISSVGLAHLGDAVYEIMVRSMLITDGKTTAAHLHQDTIKLVCAPFQALAAEKILAFLNETEIAIYRRGRNASLHNVPKNATHAQYAKATGLEALFGSLYLTGQTERLQKLFAIIMEDSDAT